ncbi:MAG: four helix bundle protein [Lewinellaceae bacterium]|nr:four helix bundle protein [Lewinellaceae bacterium]
MQYTYAFEKMAVWQNAKNTVKSIYVKTKSFPKEEAFGMTSQIRRAGVSICCNLAEGSARISPVDQNRFYEIAFGSAIEVINLLIISKEMELISDTDYVNLRSELEKITYQINQMSGKKPNKTVGVKGIQ